MATVTYQQFYYLPDDEFIELEGLNAYFEHHKNYDLYKDEMYCPECLQCKLEYTPEYSRKAYLSAKDVNQHDDACSFKYGYLHYMVEISSSSKSSSPPYNSTKVGI